MMNSKILNVIGSLGCLFGASVAVAGTVFLPPPSTTPIDQLGDETFPESHFGAQLGAGVSQGYAAKQVNDMETPDEENGRVSGDGVSRSGGTRGIASVGDNPNSGAEAAIVTTQAGTQDVPDSVVSRKGVQEVSIIASDLGYFPKTVFVSRDVPVRMYVTSSSKNTLCIMMDSFQVRRQVKVQKIEEITFVPNVPGKYRFYCPVNGMEGSLVVKEFSNSLAQEEQAPVQPVVRYQGPAVEEKPRDPNAPMSQGTTSSSRVPAGGRAVPQYAADWGANGQ